SPSREWLFDDARTLDDLREVFRRTIHDRNLEVVDFDKGIVDVQSTQCGKKMLYSREHNAGTHQCSCVTAMRNGLDGRRDLEAAEIGATKHVSCIRRSGEE